ncbi:MAG: thiol:disulfide interchange protein [Stygiobacter sp.]|nr:MAG: thiol:disulfide interchange protein [Stygiobacter sp.]
MVVFSLISINANAQSVDSLLSNALKNIMSYKCVEYSRKAFGHTYLFKVAVDSSDKYVGARMLIYEDDITRIDRSYHDGVKVTYDWESKTVKIDTFRNHIVTLVSPFLIEARELLKYVLSKNIKATFKSYKKKYEFSFTFTDLDVDFSNLPIPVSHSKGTTTTYKYITDSSLKPVKLISTDGIKTNETEMLNIRNYKESEIRNQQQGVFMPEGFTLARSKSQKKNPLIETGQKALSFTLSSLSGKTVELKDYLGKVVLLEFTALGCSACEAAVPFLKTLAEKNDKDFAFISIMCYTNNVNNLKRYSKKNKLNYDLLIADKETIKNYKVVGAPLFVVLDKRGTIKWVNMGYTNEETGKKICKQIEHVLD